MLNKINISPKKQKLIVYIVLIMATLAVYWQVNKFDFISIDDPVYVTENIIVQSGITLNGVHWAFSNIDAMHWHPITWISLMFDYELFGLNAGGYHVTNLILHILSTLLLFLLFCRMTGEIWKSAFVAGLFALHPLHVESVAWIAERKDVLSAFFWMLTLCLYVYYTEKPAVRRYLLVIFSFVLALMSKPMVVTLPLIMILLDYWPLKRFESKKDNLILWQLKEKLPFFILSAVFFIITLYAQHNRPIEHFPLSSRIANALVSIVSYMQKTFWPNDMVYFYPFPVQSPVLPAIAASLLIIIFSAAVIVWAKRMPYLLVGWLWYLITLLPVIGIIQIGEYAMADRYHYLPSIGIAFMLAWGMPLLFRREDLGKKVLLPAGIAVLTIMAILSWRQCGYWKNSFELNRHILQITKDGAFAHNLRGVNYCELGQYQPAIDEFNKAIRLAPDYASAYNNRGVIYFMQGNKELGCRDAKKACALGKCKLLEGAKGKGYCQ
jgi:hypothetical protein